MTDHLSVAFWLTIGWLMVTGIGGVWSFVGLYDALKDKRWLHNEDLNGPRTVIVNAGIRSAAVRELLFFTFFVIGINSVLGSTVGAMNVRELILIVLIVCTLLVTAFAAFLDVRDSTRLLVMLKIAQAIAHERTQVEEASQQAKNAGG